MATAAAFCLVAFVWGVHLRAAPQPAGQDLAVQAKPARRKGLGPLGPVTDLLGGPLAPLVLRFVTPAARGRLRLRIQRAGRPNGMTVDDYARDKAGCILFYGSVGLFLISSGQLPIGLFLIIAGLLQTDVVLWGMARDRQAAIQKALPDFLDVLTVTVSAGLGFRHALERVSETMPGALSEEMTTALKQMELGAPLRDAFVELRQRNASESLASFVTAILQAEELGAPLARALTEISIDMRQDAHQHARRRAQKAEPQVTLITSFLMLPGVLLLIFGLLWFSSEGAFSRVLG
ncbi:type II secretion system F family protein [Actinomadura alba]|uniref:Type II secretion system F family protein n=2 Tax=Actinomadura alba TaxID=406431 RepID=A0ABR7LR46_9ACTN|nr:type II secretion system F family protein [Actinomadura alba]MBC6467069.1 type II secretion system F family protein [Actinomadura alba]